MQRLNFDVDVVDVEWGYGIDLGVLRQKLQADTRHEIKAVCAVHNETATGVTNDLKGIRTILGNYLVIFVDLAWLYIYLHAQYRFELEVYSVS